MNAKISFVVKSQHLLKMRYYSRHTGIFSIIKGSFSKYSLLSTKLKQNYKRNKYNFFGHSSDTYICEEKNSNSATNKEIEEDKSNYNKYFKEIANGNPDIEKQLKIIEFEINIQREYYRRIPKIIRKEHWQELLEYKTMQKRFKYLSFLFKNEIKSNSNKKQLRKQASDEFWKEKEKEYNIPYGISKNSLFLRLYKDSLNHLKNLKLFGALCYSQPIIFDCSYGNYMTKLNSKFCAKQILTAYSHNRDHPNPFHIKLCNVNPNDQSIMTLSKSFKNNLNCYIDSTREDYLDLYPKEKLVYLTPDSQHILNEYDDEDIYIIGAFVDRGTGEKLSLAKAKEENLRMAKFPLDKYLIWKRGSKTLPLNIVLSILADLRLYRDWNIAFKNVPSRFTALGHNTFVKHRRSLY